ncbi:hypothetical protein BIW11_08648 [Tropilaelaps mercedesae]|uniref:Uncharacterized protein n=1 Tax=Tropilaelaps mercedesae TaxID=418985 RepID=A0A1V9XNP4_9ACAR|nr:hypothetical protein BIW11_08648 [Tropilaelaps mercedesae]
MSGHFDPTYVDRRNAEFQNMSTSTTYTIVGPDTCPPLNPTYPNYQPQYQSPGHLPPMDPSPPMMPSIDPYPPPDPTYYPPAQAGYVPPPTPRMYYPPCQSGDSYAPPPPPM